jgi:hypothetical protein
MQREPIDYPADARGYNWGIALEYIDSELGWAARAGRFLQPIESNGLALDSAFMKHYGDMVELEKSYTLFGQDGKVRLMGWRNKTRMGRFDDAIALGPATGRARVSAMRSQVQASSRWYFSKPLRLTATGPLLPDGRSRMSISQSRRSAPWEISAATS